MAAFPLLLLVQAFCSHSEQCEFVEYHLEKLCKGAALPKKGVPEMPNVFALTGLIFHVSAPFLSNEVSCSHVNSSRGNILKFFLHKSSRGIQGLVLKYQE